MSYGPKERAAAAKKGWQNRRKELPAYDENEQSMGSAGSGDTLDLASELPVSSLFEAGGIANWPDPIYDINPDGYKIIHNCFPVIETVEKRAIRIAKLNWSVVGTGARADAYREIIDQAHNWTDMVKWLMWADIDGVRYMQIKQTASRTSTPYIVPTFFMGGRRKYKAGGDVQWDGRKLVRVKKITGKADVDYARLPQWQFIIHRPGAGSSPEGDSQIGTAVYRVAYSWEEALKNTDAHMELFGVPIRVFKGKMDKVRPDQVSGLLQDRAARLKLLKQNKQMLLSDEEMLDLIEPKGQGFKDMIEYAKYLEGLLDQMFLANQLTSTVNDANRTGNTMAHLSEESESIYGGAMQLAESLNRHLMPWIARKNPEMPELADGEFEPYLWPEPPEADDDTDDQEITVDDDGNPVVESEPGEEDAPPEADAVIRIDNGDEETEPGDSNDSSQSEEDEDEDDPDA